MKKVQLSPTFTAYWTWQYHKIHAKLKPIFKLMRMLRRWRN